MSGTGQARDGELLHLAARAYQSGDWAQAEQHCRALLAQQPEAFEALSLLGVILAQTRRPEAAAALLQQALRVQPDNAVAHNNYANVLRELARWREALTHYERALQLDPRFAEAYDNRGGALRALGDSTAALESYRQALALRPDHPATLFNRAVVLQECDRLEEALEGYARALALRPDFADAHYNQGIVLEGLRRREQALHSYDCAARLAPNGRVYNNRGNVLLELGDSEAALRSYETALRLDPTLADACQNRGHALRELKRLPEALASYARALQLNPQLPWLYGTWLYTKLQLCDWQDLDAAIDRLGELLRAGRPAAQPFIVFVVSDAPELQSAAALISSVATLRTTRALPAPTRAPAREQIRIAYYSADFHNHATAQLMAGLFEAHDRRRFEVSAFWFGRARADAMTGRLQRAFARFVDVRDASDREVAQLSRDCGIDIAVDLKGFTQDARPGIFAQRAAPVQVSYLGYPGTSAARYIDYLIADAVVIPPAARLHYTERLIYLPHSYYPNSYRSNELLSREALAMPRRAELGLPPEGFVYCCFNGCYKILPECFSGWMRILAAVPDSVLWLLADNAAAAANLRAAAEARGVSGARIIVAAPLPLAQHLARYRAADLFLDSLPCNAHTTATDALWMGLPVLTRPGQALAARVAASVLSAVGLPELIALDAAAYEALAIALARDRDRLAALRARLAALTECMPLFDTALLTRHLEYSYRRIYQRYQAGLPAADLVVPAELPASTGPAEG